MHGFEKIRLAKDCSPSNDPFFIKDLFKLNMVDLNYPLVTPLKEKQCDFSKAPNDLEQIESISDYLSSIKELKFDIWKTLPLFERFDILQEAENKIAVIEHRKPCSLVLMDLKYEDYGFYSFEDKTITLNVKYVNDDDFQSYKETLDTLIHEGRHAYQDYNLTERPVHPRDGEVNIWKWNENDLGYQNALLCGFEAYAMQPVETDARAFAEDVLNYYLIKYHDEKYKGNID